VVIWLCRAAYFFTCCLIIDADAPPYGVPECPPQAVP
jgi:hypothetical protein